MPNLELETGPEKRNVGCNNMKTAPLKIPGSLVAIPIPGTKAVLDGFLAAGRPRNRRLLLFVHGMASNFYRSPLKKAFFLAAAKSSFDVLSFNNRGSDEHTADERFRDCVADIEAAIRFGRSLGYRSFVLAGHSTGCQKIACHQALRARRDVAALVLLGLGDDYAIVKRDLGRRLAAWVARARLLVRAGRGDTRLPACCLGFSARRFLSIADRRQLEAKLFDLDGPMTHYGRVRIPILAVLAGADEYATQPVTTMARILCDKSRAPVFESIIIPGVDHGFRGRQLQVARTVLDWLERNIPKHRGTR